jgi:hypothetical protein
MIGGIAKSQLIHITILIAVAKELETLNPAYDTIGLYRVNKKSPYSFKIKFLKWEVIQRSVFTHTP